MESNYLVAGIYRNKNLFVTFGILLVMLLAASCGPGKQSRRANIENFEDLREVVNNREFEIENEWAEPLSGSQVNLIGNPNYIRFLGDSVKLFLPYFGVRHAGGNYGGRDGGIEFEGVPEELEITEDKENKSISIEFQAEEDQEDFDFLIKFFPNGRTTTSVNSSERSTISYRGFLNRLPDDFRRD